MRVQDTITSMPEISLGTAALAIFVLCAGFVLLRGITRMILGTIVLGLSAWAALLAWQHAPAWSVDWFGKSMPWFTNGLPAAIFISAGLVLRMITNLFVRPFRGAEKSHRPSSLAGAAGRMVLALVPTSLLSVIGIAIVHHGGAVSEVRSSSEHPNASKTAPATHLIGRMKDALDTYIPANWMERLDPLADPARLALAKLIAGRSAPESAPGIDPNTGKPIPRAIVVPDPELQALAREGKFDTLLRHPRLTKALADPKVRKYLQH
jgi:hypothetical protein